MDKGEKYVGSLWYIDKERLSGTFTLHGQITRIEVNPFKQNQFSVSGKNYFKIWEFDINNKTFEVSKDGTKNFEILQNENIIDHCWLVENNYLIAATAENWIYIFLNGQLVKKFEFDYIPSELRTFKQLDGEGDESGLVDDETSALGASNLREDNFEAAKKKAERYIISCIEATSRGFAIGLKNIGVLCIYEIGIKNPLLSSIF